MPVSELLLTCCNQELRGRPGGLRHCALGRCLDLTSTPVSVSAELVCWHLASPNTVSWQTGGDRIRSPFERVLCALGLPVFRQPEVLPCIIFFSRQCPAFLGMCPK